METLRECPFCENTDIKIFYWDNALVWKLHCSMCNITYTHVDKEKIIKLWNSRSREDVLQTSVVILREEIQLAKISYADIENKHNTLQIKLDTLKEDMQTATTSYIVMRNNRDALQKSLDENVKFAKQECNALQIRLSDEKTAHQYYIDAMQTRLAVAEQALLNIISSNTKLDAIRAEEYKIAHDALKKMKGE